MKHLALGLHLLLERRIPFAALFERFDSDRDVITRRQTLGFVSALLIGTDVRA